MLYSNIAYTINKLGKKIEVPIESLNNSNHRVIIKCDECGKIYETQWSNRKKSFENRGNDLCNSCSKKGKYNSQYGKDRKEILKYARTFNKQNPMKGKHHNDKAKEKMSKIKSSQISRGKLDIKSNNRGHKSQYKSLKNNEIFYADSVLERLRMEQLDMDNNVLSWTKRHKIYIPYMIENQVKTYVPDFLIIYKNGIKIIEELKGYVKQVDLIKKDYAEIFCKHNGYVYKFTTQKEMNINGEYRAYLKKIKKDGEI